MKTGFVSVPLSGHLDSMKALEHRLRSRGNEQIEHSTLSLPNLEGAEAPVSTLCDLFDRAVATAPDAVALRHRGVALTYREMGRAVSALALRLAEIVAPGDAVGLFLPNSIEFQIGYFASLKALAAPALFNPMYPAEQLVPLLREVAPRAVICAPAAREMMVRITDDLGIPGFICLGQDMPGLVCVGQDITVAALIDHPEVTLHIRAATPTDCGALLFSGGTTGLPKAVEHTHGRLIQATRGMEHVFPPSSDREVFLAIVPFTHIYGFLLGVLVPISARGETVIAERFQPEYIVELLERHHVTFFGGGPPAIYAGALAASNLSSADLSALKLCPGGGAPFPIELMDRWRRATGLQIREGYGMTEVCPISGPTEQSGIPPGSVGKPVPGCEVQVVDLDTGVRVLPRGERGELRVCGPHMMPGYRGRPKETAQTIRNGFIYTGDIGYLDEDGFVFITDRKKDVVFVKGFNVFPREVEEVISTHSSVGMVGVVGVLDARTAGERLVAFVVPRAGETVDEAEILAHCASRLVDYKCPAEVRVVEQLPITSVRKLDRAALRRLVSVGQSSPPTLDDRVPAGSEIPRNTMKRIEYSASPSAGGVVKLGIDLSDQVAIVTGGGRGIGREIALALAGAGAAVAVAARSADQVQTTADIITSVGGRAMALPVDVTDETGVQQAIATIQDTLGAVTLLVNNAGVGGPIGSTWEVSATEWWRTMEVNLRGVLLWTNAVLPGMVAHGRGRIINIASNAGAYRWPNLSGYSVSKAAVIKFTENLSLELRNKGIAVFAVHPGLVRMGLTELPLNTVASPDSPAGKVAAWVRQEIAEGRDLPPERITRLVVELAHGLGDVLTGRYIDAHEDLTNLLERADQIREDDLCMLRIR